MGVGRHCKHMANDQSNVGSAPVTNPYTPLAVTNGVVVVDDWGGCAQVLATSDSSTVLVLDMASDGKVLASMPWHLGPDEQLADPLRVLRDDEQHSDENPGLVRY